MTVPEQQPAARILVVCTGNVCRSPLVERLLQRAVDETYGPGAVEVRSAGTGALIDHEMDERSARVLAALGGDSEGFLARYLMAHHVRDADLVLTATTQHRSAVVQLHPRALKRAFTVRELAALLEGVDLAALPTAPAERIEALVEVARPRRALLLGGADRDHLDIVDPFRRSDEVYEQMRDEVEPAVRVIAGALTGRTPA